MSRIPVLYVITTLDTGGAEGQFAVLADRLDRVHFDVTVVTLGGESALGRRLRTAGITVESLGLRDEVRGWRLPRVLPALWRLVRIVRARRPMIVHGVLIHGNLLAALAARLCGVPVFVSSRRALSTGKTRWRFLRTLERAVNRFARLIVANSEAVRADAIRTERIEPGRVCVIYNGVDDVAPPAVPDATLRKELELDGRHPVIGVIANFLPYKGHAYFLQAFAALSAEVPGATAILVGDGPERSACEALARQLGLHGLVRFVGRRADVPRVLSVIDFVVHPSLEEGFSNAILEAMAAGKAVIATRVGGNPEAVLDNITGAIIPPRDTDAMLESMRTLAHNRKLCESMGTAARRRAVTTFGIQTMVRRYEQLYASLARGSKGATACAASQVE